MIGIFGVLSTGNSIDIHIITKSEIILKNALFRQNMLNKFVNDKSFNIYDNYVTVIDGCILNLKELLNYYKCNTIGKLMIAMYLQNGKKFFAEFRGNFCGCLYDVRNKEAIIFTDHLGNKQLYYCMSEEKFIFSSNINDIAAFLKENKIPVNLNIAGAYSMLSYGYMYHNITMYENIYRVLPGHYLKFTKGQISDCEYYYIDNSASEDISEEEALEKIDHLFLTAVKLQADKNKEYGYLNYAPLSAGLDSRMTVYALNRLGLDNVINFTYSETGQLDHIIPMKIAAELKNKWLFKSLDNGLDLLEIDKSVRNSDSRFYYPWTSQLNEFMKLISQDDLGVIHTGVIGDVVTGTFFHNPEDYFQKRVYKIGDGAISCFLTERFKELVDEVSYKNYETGMFYNRAFNGACLGYSTTFQNYAESMSPFMYLDFFEYCLKLPMKYRLQHEIYYKWVKKFYPAASEYSHNGLKIHFHESNIRVRGKKIYIDTIPSRINLLLKNRLDSRYGMNPFQYWYDNNVRLKKQMDNYFQEKKEYLSPYPELKNDTEDLYIKGTAIEKTLCISLVGTVSQSNIE